MQLLSTLTDVFHAETDPVRLRRWDDRAKVAGAATPGLGHYLRIAAHVAATSCVPGRTTG